VNYDRTELLDRLAAEYVFGTMSARVRSRFQTILRALPAARNAVHTWEQRLIPFAQSIPPEQPSAKTWRSIEQRIAGRSAQSSSPWLVLLRPLLGLAFGVVATIGLVRLEPELFVPVDEIVQEYAAVPASYVGILTDADDNPVALASSMRHGKTMSVKLLRKIEVPAGKLLQLWAVANDGVPFPLGVVPGEGKDSFEMADTSQNLLKRVSRLAVSIEDAPARPGSIPSSFVLTGHCVRLW